MLPSSGSGGPGLGFGPGDGGVAPEQRWSIIYKEGQTADEYARQLDALGVEMAVVAGADQLLYISNFSSPTPTKRRPPGAATTDSISSGKAGDERVPTSRSSKRRTSRSARRHLPVLSPRDRKTAAGARSPVQGPTARRDPRDSFCGRTRRQRLRFPGRRSGIAQSESLTRMATLEVHDGEGRVQFIELEQRSSGFVRHELNVRRDPGGQGIRPVHGRIRWSANRYKVEASPDAEYVLVNGHKMSASSIGQGDEIVVGGCRIFMLRGEGGPRTSARSSASPGRCANAPGVRDRAGRRPTRRGAGGPRARNPGARLVLEKDDWLESLRPKSRPEAAELASSPLSRQAGRARREEQDVALPESGTKPRWRAWVARLWSLGASGCTGRERILTSPLVIGLVVAIALLAGMGFWLRAIIAANAANRTFNHGVQRLRRWRLSDGDARVRPFLRQPA